MQMRVLHGHQALLYKSVTRFPAFMLLRIYRIGIIVRLIVEAREFSLLERVAVVCCHDLASHIKLTKSH